jgi:hypothetical protein
LQLSESSDEILAQIFSPELPWSHPELPWSHPDQKVLSYCPSNSDLRALADLLGKDPREEDLQRFLEDYPQFLMGICGSGYDSPLAFLVKPPVGTSFNADFAVLSYGQGGCRIYLVEIKRSVEILYIKTGEQSGKLREAIRQIEDRNLWLKSGVNIQTFVRDQLEYAKQLPQYPERAENNSFRFKSSQEIEKAWRTFGGYDHALVKHIIVIGRWANLSEQDRKRLILHNTDNGQLYSIFTYDQLARRGFDRPYFLPP